jgi:hypothetical protein
MSIIFSRRNSFKLQVSRRVNTVTLGLKWDYIRLDNRLTILPMTKNNTVRVLPINDTLYGILAAMPHKVGYVFGNGKPIADIKRSFHTACRKAGIENFRYHDLRHTYASHLAMRGVYIRALQELPGHKTLAMTQRDSPWPLSGFLNNWLFKIPGWDLLFLVACCQPNWPKAMTPF